MKYWTFKIHEGEMERCETCGKRITEGLIKTVRKSDGGFKDYIFCKKHGMSYLEDEIINLKRTLGSVMEMK